MRIIDADALLKEISETYDLDYGETLIDPRHFADLIESAPTIEQPKWIPVAERLPEPNENPVLAVFSGVVNPAWCYSGLWELPGGIISDKVTHWRPLPEPPKGDG